MREIKFRAWEKNLKEMIPVYDIQFYNPNKIEVEGVVMLPKEKQPLMININSAWRSEDEIVLMQFTGLKDKNGKEIYEGDIVRRSDGTLGEVVWNEKHAQFRIESDANGGYYEQTEEEVVGNIYENPELLKA